MKMPDDWIIEYEDYKKEELKGNEGIYDNFNDMQLNAVKAYFKWRTKERFKELCKDTSLAAKPKKAEVLADVMGNATDWVYDGCVDTGYLGASHCELGHALRYEHYAFSPSTGRSIVFGVNCAADFFGIEPERLRKINTVQDDTLNEIKKIVFIRNTGKHQSYSSMFYRDLMDIVDVLRDRMSDTFGYDWNQQMAAFLRSGLPLTSSMVDRVDYVRKKFYFQRAEELKRQRIVDAILQGNPNRKRFMDIAKSSNLHLIKSSMGYVANYANDASEYRLKCNRFVIDQAMRFSDIYDKLVKQGIKDFEKFVNSGKDSIVYVHASKGDRIATIREKEELGSKTFTKEVFYLSEDKHRMLQIFGWAIYGNKKMYLESKCDGYQDGEISMIEQSAELLKNALRWLNSTDFKSDIKELARHVGKSIYPESAEDEVQPEKPFDKIVDYILVSCPRETNVWIFNAAIDICEKYRKFNSRLTDKQKNAVRKAYESLTKLPEEEEKPEIVKKAEYVVNKSDEPIVLTKYKFELDICKTVASTLRASEKQAKFIERVYDALKNQEYNEPVSAKQIFIDEPDEAVKHAEFKFSEAEKKSDETSGSIDDIFLQDYSKQKARPTTSTLIEMPSIMEISNALGSGAFKLREEDKK